MDVVMAVLADSANISREGKLNILGIFDVLNATSFPVVHPQMQLVIKFEAHSAEAGKKRKLDIKFMDDDGKSVFELHGELTLGGPARSGEPFKFDHILSLNGLRFEKPGTYEFKIYVEGEAKKEVPLKVIKLASPSPPG